MVIRDDILPEKAKLQKNCRKLSFEKKTFVTMDKRMLSTGNGALSSNSACTSCGSPACCSKEMQEYQNLVEWLYWKSPLSKGLLQAKSTGEPLVVTLGDDESEKDSLPPPVLERMLPSLTNSDNQKQGSLANTPRKTFVVCSVCGKRFKKQHHLNHHMTVHTVSKKFSCTVCSREFGSWCSLRTHQKKASKCGTVLQQEKAAEGNAV